MLLQLLICLSDQAASVECCAGEELRASTSFYDSKVRASQLPSDLKRLQSNSYLQQRTLHCSYGPEDNSNAVPVSLMQPKRPDNKRCGKTERRKSCKRGCLMQFTITQLALWPDVTHIVGRHFDHANAAGSHPHGPNAAPGVPNIARVAPHLSSETRGWVKTLLSSGQTVQKIMLKHQQRLKAAKDAGVSLGRDAKLKPQDVRNCEHTLAESLWKLHEDEATSVRLFTQQHQKHIFIYKEQLQPDPPQKQGQKFVLGLQTDTMQANAIQHGHDNVVLMDATFGTKHMKFSLYTALVMDEWGNGMPIFEVLCESTTQADIAEWMLAFQQHMQTAHTAWRPSCFMADDAQGEINAMR